jgi:hypothetical protein
MGNSSPKVVETSRFKKEALQLLESDGESILAGLTWALVQNPLFGQQVRGTEQRVWVLYRGGFAYLAYYSMSHDAIVLESIVKRNTPIAPGPLGLEP